MSDPSKPLSGYREAFCQLYAANPNATEAYKKAGYKFSNDHAAQVHASRLVLSGVVASRIAYLREQAAKPLGLTRRRIIEGLLKEAERTGEGTSQSARVRAWELLGKHKGMFKDAHEVTPTVSLPEMKVGEEAEVDIFIRIRAAAERRLATLHVGGEDPRNRGSEPVDQADSNGQATRLLDA